MFVKIKEHSVARRKLFQPWPKTGPEGAAVGLARARYEAGTHDMAQGWEGNGAGRTCVLYSIPLKRPARGREGYFNTRN